jgi:hypothetical protein
LDLGVRINRDCTLGALPFGSVFEGFDRLEAVRGIFGGRTGDVIGSLMVDVEEGRGYLHINDVRGSVVVNAKYLRDGPERYIYLDVVHELVHIRQLREGRELFDRTYKYVDRPTEVEAYHVTVNEARRLGLTDAEIAEYLRVEWVTDEEFKRFLEALNVRP